ncbi:MAG: AAA family ATPase, partial [Anaerolineae bacterium]|nr:AAA family ATPase [Anaerolineae bacterium]
MYTSFHIENFRLFDTLDIEHLARVNLITGRNNSGKTSLLEAVFVHGGGYMPELVLRLHALRGHSQFRYDLSPTGRGPWDSAFHEFDSSREIVIKSQYLKGTRTQTIKVLRTPEEIKASGVVIPRQSQNGGEVVTALSSEAVLILELRYQTDDQDVRFHAYVDKDGIRFDPTPNPRFPGHFLRGSRA